MILQKRDNNGYAIAPALIIFLVIVGAGAMVCFAFAAFRFYSPNDDDSKRWVRSPEQDAYMREVRERNWSKLPKLGVRNLHDPSNSNLGHAPMSPSAHSTTTYG